MGKALREERVPGGLINVLNDIEQGESCLRQRNRDRFLLVFIFGVVSVLSLTVPASSQSAPVDQTELSPDLATRLQSQIANGNIESKRSALSEIRNIETAAASRIALPALRDKEPIVRATAASSVIFLPPAEAATALLPMLTDRSEFVRREAVHALGEVGDPSATNSLVRILKSERILEVRTAAAMALGKIGDPTAIDDLVSILKSRIREDDEFLRRSAARSIGQIAQIERTGVRRVLTPQNFLPDKYKDLGPSGTASKGARTDFSISVGVLIAVLRNSRESDDTRREAAFSLGAIGDAKAVPVLQTFTSAADPYLAEISREALLKISRYNSSE